MSDERIEALRTAFQRARQAVVAHTDAMATAGATWREETLTEIALAAASPTVRFADFNRTEEATVGADWLWWWVSPDGTSFGTLVQAKNLTFTHAGTPMVEYKHAGGRQLEDLLTASDILEVPATYAIYFGGPGYRRGWPCAEEPPGCGYCIRRAITMVPAMLFTGSLTPTYAAERACESGVPLEQLTGDKAWWHRSIPPRVQVSASLEEFLSNPQYGARAVAREVFGRVSLRRSAELGHVIEESAPPRPLAAPEDLTADQVFTDLPADVMHSGIEYFDHVLRGLRRTPPEYVLDILNETEPDPALAKHVVGIVVIPTG